MLRRILLSIALCTASPLAAQSSAPQPFRQALTINPIGLPFELISAEYERALNPAATFGIGASYFGAFDEGDYISGEAKLRYYPNERAIRGFSIGGTIGFARVSADADEFTEEATTTGFTTGVILDYNWLLGRQRRFVVGTGIGAKRIFADDDDFDDLEFAYPTLRLQVGYAF